VLVLSGVGSVSVTPTAIEVISRAVIRRGHSVLLVRALGDDWWFLPGGHVEPGERSAHALSRELREEVGAQVRVSGDPVAVAENFYDDKEGPHHELNVVFIVVDPGGPLTSLEPHLQTAWVPDAELAQIDIRPPAVRDTIRAILT
jgi:ADP-ribose pyrophosphatase YjhB (NUDIX family)